MVAASVAALVVVSSLAAMLLWPAAPEASPVPSAAGAGEPPERVPEPPPAAEPTVPVELPAALAEAMALLDEGKLLEARDRLDEMAAPAEEGRLDDATLEAYRAVEEIVLRRRAESLERELSAALAGGTISRLRGTLSTVTAAEEELLAESQPGGLVLDDARRARSLLDAFDQAVADGNSMRALDAAFGLAEAFPAFDSALRARERATAAVEGEVDALIAEGRLEDAEERLVLLQSLWPDRPGLDGKLGTVRQRMESEARFDTLLAAARAAAARARPHEGLRLLAGVQPRREYVERFASERQVLERQLAELDGDDPTIRVTAGEIEFRKGSPVVVDLAASDDYEVAEVTFWARSHRQSEYTELPVRRVEEGIYRVQIEPAFHEDKALRFWASVRDVSGNEGRIGSAEAPVEVKRDRWFR